MQHYEFLECDACDSKPGTPPLCRGCLHNRETISAAKQQMDALTEKVKKLRNTLAAAKDVLSLAP